VGEPLVTFAARRFRNGALTLTAALIIGTIVWLQGVALRDPSFLTGWLLVGLFAVLAAYNLRKKVPMLPLLRSATWLQVHIYLGLLTCVVFLLHAGVTLPNGALESTLWTVVVVVLVTGILGIAISRLAPPTLASRGERLIYERIPAFRAQLAQEVDDLVTKAVENGGSKSLADYHARRLKPYFARPRHVLRHLFGSGRPVRRICRELHALERYIAQEDQPTLNEIEDRVLAKDNLDYQYVWQSLLKGWLFVHIPLTYVALILSAVHIVLVYAFAAEAL
jgi:hypothetical protein